MKKIIEEMAKETNDIVIVDTNVIINLEHYDYSNIDLKAICNIFDTDIKPFVTDLSFCELIIGSNCLENFKSHCKELNVMEFMLCGNNEELSDFLFNANYDLIQDDESFKAFKESIVNLRNKALFPMFHSLASLYIKTSIMV